MRFSIILPSRDRIHLLGKFLDSVKNNTDDLSQVEVLIVHDNDDSATAGFIDQVPYPFIKKWAVARSMNFSKDYYNFLASKASGEWIICCNDDARVETPHWDTIAFNVLNPLPRVIFGHIEDGLGGAKARGGGDYCCFPLQGMQGVHAMGFVFPARIPVWGCDMWVSNLYSHIDSRVNLPIKFMHYCHHNRTREQDHISKRIAQNQVAYSVRPERREIEALLGALNRPVNYEAPKSILEQQKRVPSPWRPAPRPIQIQPVLVGGKKKMWMGI